MPPLNSSVDVFITVRAPADHWQQRSIAFGKAPMWFIGPLHRRPRAIALGKRKIIAHADLIAVADHGRARQCEQEAIGQFQPAAITIEHGRKPASDAAVVELHFSLGSEDIEHRFALLFGQPPEVEFIMIA